MNVTATIAIALSLAAPLSGVFAQSDKITEIPYLIEVATVARESPAVTAKIANRFPAGTLVVVTKAVTGWIFVGPGNIDGQSDTEGWIQANGDNLIPDSPIRTTMRALQVKDKPWPTATKNAIIKMQARVGFTREQLDIALGDPLLESSEETASGTTESLLYKNQLIKLRAGRVFSIVKTK